MVISKLLSDIKNQLSENAEFEAKEIAMAVLGISKSELIINPKRGVSDDEAEKIMAMVSRRLMGEPLQYILGFSEFMSLRFNVNPYTLIPRSDTETLVELLIKK